MALDNDNNQRESRNVNLTNIIMGERFKNHQDHNYKDKVRDTQNENTDIVEEPRTNCNESQTTIPNNREDIEGNIKTEEDLHTQSTEENKCDNHNTDSCSLSECSISSDKDCCVSDKNDSKSEDSPSEDMDDDSSLPPAVLPVRPGFKPKGRMFRPSQVTAPEAPSFIMDVPESWGIGADGSMMEAFNKFEIKD